MRRFLLALALLLAACLPRASSFVAKSFSRKPSATHGSRSQGIVRMLQAAPAPESEEEDSRRRKQKANELAKSVAIPTASSEIPFAVPRSLTKAVLQIPGDMGVGTMAWGDPNRGFLSDPKIRPKPWQFNPADLQDAYEVLLEGGVRFFDTDESYGQQSARKGFSAEQLLGKFSSQTRSSDTALLSTGYNPVLWANLKAGSLRPRGGRRAVVSALQNSLERLESAYVDLYQLQPSKIPYIGGMDALAEGLARCKNRGLCRHIGVVDMDGAQVKAFKASLAKWDMTVAANQIEYSLIDQSRAEDGTIAECKRMGVLVFAHTPLARGLACGKYTASNPTGGLPGPPRYAFQDLEPLQPVHQALEIVAKMVTSRLSKDEKAPLTRVSTTQVSLNYVRAKGIIPLPGVVSRAQAVEVAGCLTFRLKGEEVEILDESYKQYQARTQGLKVKRTTTGKKRNVLGLAPKGQRSAKFP